MNLASALFLSLTLCRCTVIVLRRVDGLRGHRWLWLTVLRDSACVALAVGVGVAQLSETAAWGLYALWTLAAVVNVPVSRVLGSPTTAMMLRASGGAISDSLRAYVSTSNLKFLL